MTLFYHNILKAINDYKNIIRRNFKLKNRQATLARLGIKRLDIKNADAVKLHAIGTAIVQEIEQSSQYIERQQSVSGYSGTEEFLQHLKKLLSEHVIEDNIVVNTAQKSSCALIKAIQLIEIAKCSLNDDIAEQIYACAKIITKYGDKVQKNMLCKLISNTQQVNLNLFFRRLQNLIS